MERSLQIQTPPISAVRRSGGPLGGKVVTPNPPLSAVGGAQRGVGGHNFSTQWSHCFGFGLSRSPFLVLRRSTLMGLGATTLRPNGTSGREVLGLASPGPIFGFEALLTNSNSR